MLSSVISALGMSGGVSLLFSHFYNLLRNLTYYYSNSILYKILSLYQAFCWTCNIPQYFFCFCCSTFEFLNPTHCSIHLSYYFYFFIFHTLFFELLAIDCSWVLSCPIMSMFALQDVLCAFMICTICLMYLFICLWKCSVLILLPLSSFPAAENVGLLILDLFWLSTDFFCC